MDGVEYRVTKVSSDGMTKLDVAAVMGYACTVMQLNTEPGGIAPA